MQNQKQIIDRYTAELKLAFEKAYQVAHGDDDQDDKNDFIFRHVKVELIHLGLIKE